MIGVDTVHPFGMKNGFARGDFSMSFKNPNDIARRVLDVCVIPLPT